jgi:benzoate/toluate 1,2-dioxygenase beta subunit
MTTRLSRAGALAIASRILLREAELLDREAYDEWLKLLDNNIVYWAPLDPHAKDEFVAPSIYFEDRVLLEMRIRRFTHAKAFGREGGRRTLHQVTGIEARAGGAAITSTSTLVVFEYFDGRTTIFPGRQTHRLVRKDGRWRIARKEVRLISMTDVFDPIEIIL